MRRVLLPAALAVLAALLVLAAGCGHKRTTLKNVAGAEARIGKVEITGNEALDDREIEDHMNLQQSRWFPLPKREWFLPGLIPVDEERIEALYAASGYHHARVVSFETRERRKGKVVDLRVEVEENAPTLVRSIRFAWPTGRPDGPPDRRATPEKIQTHCDLEENAAFDIAELRASEATMRAALQQRGYAFAVVLGKAEVDRVGRTADVVFEIDPGPYVRIGEITIRGLQAVPERAVRVEVEGFQGRAYAPTRIEDLEGAIYGLDVFSSVAVTVAEAPRDTADGKVVDVTVDVVEAQPQSIRLGVGIGVDPQRWEQYGAMRYSHTNIDRKLARFDLKAKAGYAELPAIWNPREHGPIAELSPSIRRKGWLERKLVWTAAPSFELGIQPGYQFYAPKTRVGVGRFFTRFFELELSHNFRFVDFFNVSPVLDASRSILGLDFRDPYLLSFIEITPRVHLTDRLIDPRHGVVLGVTYNLAGGIFGGDYDYNRITPELKAYWTPLKNRLQFAARGSVGFISPFGDEPGAPFDLKYYLGGSNTVRGYGWRVISPSVEYCTSDGDCRRIPVGGQTMVNASAEIRARVWKGLWLVAFSDMGDVRSGVNHFAPFRWSYTMGPGIRYHSKIGVFRLDAGFRLNDSDYGEGQPIAAVHFGLGEAF
jgi:outer membrane protein assembly factor BamA